MTRTVPLQHTIDVSISTAPRGLGDYSTNSIVLLTNEAPLSTQPYIWAVNVVDVIDEYGTNSLTAKMAKAFFTPVPNLRTGNGQLLVFPYSATNATPANVKTVTISSTMLTNLKTVSNGDLTIEINGTDHVLTKLNFTKVSTLQDVVDILKNQYLDCDIEVDSGAIKFTSRKYGATDSTISLKATADGTGTDLYGSDYLYGANAVETDGVDSSGTTVAEAILAVDEIAYVGGVVTTQTCENSVVIANATALQETDHIYYEAVQSLANIATLGGAIKGAGLTKTRLLAKTDEGTTAAKCAIASYATVAQSVNYSGTETAMTMNLKELTGISPDGNINTTYYNLAKANGVDIYASTEGLSCVYSFDNGYYTDEATNLLWFKKALEVSGFNYLRKTNTKIPQTESGMVGLKNAYEQRCSQAVRNNVIGVGLKWNDTIPFGNPDEFARNIEEKGYYIYSIPIAEQAQSEREARIAPLVQIAIKLSGAIHASNVIVQVQR